MAARGRAPPLGLLALAVLLALAAVGVGYALWSKTLVIEGTAHTGRVHASWETVVCTEFHTWPRLPTGPGDQGEAEGKDVGSTSATIDPQDPNVLHVVIQNGYPSYAVDCQVEFTNDGSIPWVIRGTTIQGLGSNLTNCSLAGAQRKTLTCDQITVVFVDGILAPVDPGDAAASSLRVHIEQPAEQDARYEFAVKVCVAQWNEEPSFDACLAAQPGAGP